jgi:hypothetical protein
MPCAQHLTHLTFTHFESQLDVSLIAGGQGKAAVLETTAGQYRRSKQP